MESTELAPQNLPPGLWSQVLEAAHKLAPDFPQMIAETLVSALTAEGWYFDKKSNRVESKPDTKARLDAVKLILSYSEGLPLQRILEHKINERRGSLHEALRESPELRAALQRELEKADFRKGPRTEKPAEIVPP